MDYVSCFHGSLDAVFCCVVVYVFLSHFLLFHNLFWGSIPMFMTIRCFSMWSYRHRVCVYRMTVFTDRCFQIVGGRDIEDSSLLCLHSAYCLLVVWLWMNVADIWSYCLMTQLQYIWMTALSLTDSFFWCVCRIWIAMVISLLQLRVVDKHQCVYGSSHHS